MKDIGEILGVLSSMITPVVLIMATSSLILATSQRLNRLIERTRKLFVDQRNLTQKNDPADESPRVGHIDRAALVRLLSLTTRRVRFLQRTMTVFYFALCLFVLTSISIGFFEITALRVVYLPLVMSMIGASCLLAGTIMLLMESRLAWMSVEFEMNYIAKLIDKK